jgi:hypothetical protein
MDLLPPDYKLERDHLELKNHLLLALAECRAYQFSPSPELKHGAIERAFQAMADVGVWNRANPDRVIEPFP